MNQSQVSVLPSNFEVSATGHEVLASLPLLLLGICAGGVSLGGWIAESYGDELAVAWSV